MIQIISLFTLYHSTTSTPNKRLLQQAPPITEVYGSYNQQCMSPASDFACQFTHQAITDEGSGVLECGVEYSCCLCGSITCGSETKPCDTFKAGADMAAFGVQQINIFGEVNGNGAVIDCNGQYACGATKMTGSWIDTVRCASDGSCSNAVMQFTDSKGIICGKGACVGATVILASNRGGELICSAENACHSAYIEIDGILDVKCNGPQACQATQIVVNAPSENFKLDCNGDFSCNDLELTINVPGPEGGCANFYGHNEPFLWKGINCAASNACVGMKLTVVNNGCRTVIIEDLQCSPGGACTGAVFDLNSGTGFGVEVKNCMCGPSCKQAVGLDACYNNIQLLDCPDIGSCASQTQTIVNPGNDFLLKCSNTESCNSFKLNIIISGASQNLIQRFMGYTCDAPMACQNAVVNIENKQINNNLPVMLYVNAIQCIADKACNGAVFITGNNVEIKQIICSLGACDNCMVKQNVNSVGIACDKYALNNIQIPNEPVIVPQVNIPPVVNTAPPIVPATSTTTTTTTTTTTMPPIVPATTTTTTTSTTSAAPVNTLVVLNPNWVLIEPSTKTPVAPVIPQSPVAPAIPNVNIPNIPKIPAEMPPF